MEVQIARKGMKRQRLERELKNTMAAKVAKYCRFCDETAKMPANFERDKKKKTKQKTFESLRVENEDLLHLRFHV